MLIEAGVETGEDLMVQERTTANQSKEERSRSIWKSIARNSVHSRSCTLTGKQLMGLKIFLRTFVQAPPAGNP